MTMSDTTNEQREHQKNSKKTDLNYWNEHWRNNKIGFHRLTVNPHFEKNILSRLVSMEHKQCVLFPLCGKTLDMKAVLNSKHQVIGIECAQLGIEQFFKENHIEYDVENGENNSCQIYKGIDCPITIFHTNFLTFNEKLPTIDWIWDRGALVAINISDREEYRDNLLRSMKPGHTRLFLLAVCYDDPDLTGPPHNLSYKDINYLFGSACTIELIDKDDATSDFNMHSNRKVRWMENHVYLIIRK